MNFNKPLPVLERTLLSLKCHTQSKVSIRSQYLGEVKIYLAPCRDQNQERFARSLAACRILRALQTTKLEQSVPD